MSIVLDGTNGITTVSGVIVPNSTNGITGTTTNDNANTGAVGEFVSSIVANTVSLTSGTITNLTSVSLTAGDWDVWGVVTFASNSQPSTISSSNSAVSSTNNNFSERQGRTPLTPAHVYGYDTDVPCTMTRYSLSSTSSIYLNASVVFSGGVMAAGGFIGARRRR